MLFWIIAGLLSAAVAATLAVPLLRPPGDGAAGSEDLVIYRDQLAEVDRDLARGVLDPADAERTRSEIARRLIAADKAGGPQLAPAPRWGTMVVGIGTAVVVMAGSLWLYATMGSPGTPDLPRSQRLADAAALRDSRPAQAEAEAAVAALIAENRTIPPDNIQATIDSLYAAVADNPDDMPSWQLLTDVETRTGNFGAAAAAMAAVVRIRAEAATADDLAGLLDRMVLATLGYVSPGAEMIIGQLYDRDPQNIAALYYAGLLHAQTDRPDLAFTLWRRVVEGDGPENLHRRLARGQIADVAFLAGRDYTPPPEAAQPGPTAADMAAAADMAPEDRDAMVRGMVTQLAERLGTQGGPPEDWARLIAAYGVLGQTEMAGAIWAEAQIAFAQSETAMEILRAAAAEAGVAE